MSEARVLLTKQEAGDVKLALEVAIYFQRTWTLIEKDCGKERVKRWQALLDRFAAGAVADELMGLA